jgi:hypothetical protein
MDVAIQTTRRIRELVSNGVITIGVHITRDGKDIWARSVQPHPRLGITTSTSYTLEEIEEKLAKVSTVPFKKDEMPPHPNKIFVVAAVAFHGFNSVEDAITYGRKHLREVKKGGVRNKLPLDSLTVHDLDLSQKELFARTAVIGAHLTTAKIVARITSQRETLSVSGAHNLEEWWQNATAVQKLMVVMRSKHLPKLEGAKVRIHGYWLDKLETMAFPFRDAEAQVGQEEEEFSAEEGDSSAGELPEDATDVALEGW